MRNRPPANSAPHAVFLARVFCPGVAWSFQGNVTPAVDIPGDFGPMDAA
jgi:hypothetical protein